MQRHVHSKDRGRSPQAGQSGKPNRAVAAANLKVQMAKTVLRHDDQASVQARDQGQMAYPRSPPASQLQQSQLSRHDQHQQVPQQDAYDTDAASIDTTQPRGSYVQTGPGQNEGYRGQDGESEEGGGNQSEGSDSEEDEYEDQELDEYDAMEQVLGDSGHLIQDQYSPSVQKETIARLQQRGIFDDNQSYPTTTSGIMEDEGSDHSGDNSIRSPSPTRPPVKVEQQQLRQHSELQQSRTYGVPNATPVATQRGNMHHRGANARSNLVFPSTNSVPQRGVPHQQGPSRPHDPQQHGRRYRIENKPVHRIQSLPPPVVQVPKAELDDAPVDSSGILDYETDNLFTMDYANLRREDFDTIPRGKPSILSSDMQTKPLPERLKHVHERLEDGEKVTFLGSLPTAEWEDAGDWFLEQFSSILRRTKEIRQTKRKLAIEFEEEVEKRHEHVAKKQTTVKTALQKMQSQGQGLIPSPRRG